MFLEEFFPEDKPPPDSFTLYHYNGLCKDSGNNVAFNQGKFSTVPGETVPHEDIAGEAVLLEGVVGLAESNAILQTLQTKWKSLAVDWTNGAKPSIN